MIQGEDSQIFFLCSSGGEVISDDDISGVFVLNVQLCVRPCYPSLAALIECGQGGTLELGVSQDIIRWLFPIFITASSLNDQ